MRHNNGIKCTAKASSHKQLISLGRAKWESNPFRPSGNYAQRATPLQKLCYHNSLSRRAGSAGSGSNSSRRQNMPPKGARASAFAF